MQAIDLLSYLDGVKQNGTGWMARCPAHGDNNPSLSVSEKDGKLLIHCFAGCDTKEVLAAMGLTERDLFLENNYSNVRQIEPRQETPADGLAWLAEYCGVPMDFLATLPLAVRDRHIIYHFGPNCAVKRRVIGQRAFDWEPRNLANPPLWPMPGNTLPETIWLCEGESDTIVARHIGLDAFALTKGAGSPLTVEQAQTLKERGCKTVNILFDADKAGREGAVRLADVMMGAGLYVTTLDLVGAEIVDTLKGQKDLRDAWLTVRDCDELSMRLTEAAKLDMDSEPGTMEENRSRSGLREFDAADLAKAGAPVQPESFLLLNRYGYIIQGWSQIIAGYPKAGKTELTFACVRQWLDEGINVLWLSEESEAVWQQRLSQYPDIPSGLLTIVVGMGEEPNELLNRAANGSEPVIVVDTIRNLLQLNDENDNSEVARKLGQWEAALKGKTRIYLHHVRKGGGEHGHAIAGAGALLGVVDRAIELTYEGQCATRRKLTVHSRIVEAPDLLYEFKDGILEALGSPDEFSFEEVKRRVFNVVDNSARTTSEIVSLLEEPRPTPRHIRDALNSLFETGDIERSPHEERKGVTYRWRLP